MNVFQSIIELIQNSIKNGLGVERDLYQLINDKDINKVKSLFQDRDNEVLEAIKEYDPNTHEVMFRRDKRRKGKEPYKVQKLPRAWQRYINEIALFFLLAKPLEWREVSPNENTEDAFKQFEEFLRETRFNTTIRQAKRKAGSETESAKVYHIYQDKNGNPKVKVLVISKSDGYTLRPLFDQYKNLIAFAYGYFLKENGSTIEHFDILTPEVIYRTKKTGIGWEVEAYTNPTGKILAIYYRQPKEWEGAEQRINRDEYVDSKAGDINEYFADPIAAATADVIKSMTDPKEVGKLIRLNNENSKFEYVEPPTSIEMKESEKKVLRDSIHMDTFTPDFTYENIRGNETLSGNAQKQARILGYIKRDNRMEIYDELVDREKNLILSIMMNVTHIPIRSALAKLQIEHEFAEPFDEDTNEKWKAIGTAYSDGIISLQTAVELIGVANVIEELDRIKKEKKESAERDRMVDNFEAAY